jgi:catalase
LTQNPENYHEEIEQAHFSPGHTIPGWEPSADPVLQSRLFAYNDAGRYRVGSNVDNVPVNCPFSSVANFDRDGHLSALGNQGSRKNFPAKYIDPINVIPRPATEIEDPLSGTTVFHESDFDPNIDYEQPTMFYENSLSAGDRANLHGNIAGTLVNVDNEQVFNALLEQFGKVSKDFEAGVREAYKAAVAKEATKRK